MGNSSTVISPKTTFFGCAHDDGESSFFRQLGPGSTSLRDEDFLREGIVVPEVVSVENVLKAGFWMTYGNDSSAQKNGTKKMS